MRFLGSFSSLHGYRSRKDYLETSVGFTFFFIASLMLYLNLKFRCC
jgi:hypothetical protein